MRHNSNHKGVAGNCPTCTFEEELDRAKKFEKRLINARPAVKIERKRARSSYTTKLL